MLNTYLQDTQRFLREQRQEFLNPEDLVAYINRARREIAGRTKCVRRLSVISGSIVSWTLVNGGTGYTDTPTLTVSDPDFPSGVGDYPNGSQATAQAIVNNGVIQEIVSQYGGAGYFEPTLTIEDSTGSGASATANISFINKLSQGQEVYNFSDVDLTMFPGVDSCYGVQSVSIIYANYRYSVPIYSFSTYQAFIRQYPYQYQWVPTFGSQYGQGTDGSFYMYPLPSQTYQLEWDMYCLPSDLTDDNSPEAIPQPWQDAVAWYACHLGMIELQNYNAAKFFLELYEKFAQKYSNYARISRAVNIYGRY